MNFSKGMVKLQKQTIILRSHYIILLNKKIK